MAPSRLIRSRGHLRRRRGYLTAQSAAPVDRETAAPLATLTFPDEIPEQPPILTNDVHAAVSGLMDEWRHRVKLER